MSVHSRSSSTASLFRRLTRRLSVGHKTNISTELKEALALLDLGGVEDLENYFLGIDAFLEPWCVFRDMVLLLYPDQIHKPTTIAKAPGEKGIQRTELLWFYTQYDEGLLRYDARADKDCREYTPNPGSRPHYVIDKSNWGLEEHEKHLYAWMLQALKVGKMKNPWDFDYFKGRSTVSAWENVLVPIIDGVRAMYSPKGKKHYGRLALFIEAMRPSGLAFPAANVEIPASLTSSTAYRIASKPKETGDSGDQRKGITQKQYREIEKDLQKIFPEYGDLLARPTLKSKMQDWLEMQRASFERMRAAKEAIEETENMQHVQAMESFANRKMAKTKSSKQKEEDSGEDELKRSIELAYDQPYMHHYRDKRRMDAYDEMKTEDTELTPWRGGAGGGAGEISRLHLLEPESPPRTSIELPQVREAREELQRRARRLELHEKTMSMESNIVTPWPGPENDRRVSEASSVYTSTTRCSDPFDLANSLPGIGIANTADEAIYSPMDQLSAVPKPLLGKQREEYGASRLPTIHEKKSRVDLRAPSYEGNDWKGEINLKQLEEVRRKNVSALEHTRVAYPPTRLPVPIKPMPYAGNLRAASRPSKEVPEEYRGPDGKAPAAVPWPGTPPPAAVRAKSPQRNLGRIVSKENIRAALRLSTMEDEPPLPLPRTQGPAKWQTYNTNLFPRREGGGE
ncbi:hypothetical protein GMOD_00000725 [Pyrenophora seminiperda CCB06]|uniref:Uncharacterized protein n=1 Tax=Pyrenophora seminiperda CCB06 TaxID=1302712 RepID=A0A3M7M812_9PLEO|nr:hypothetical protein GMOD_00000725 [Pyrenophora seminiperda CCB06]